MRLSSRIPLLTLLLCVLPAGGVPGAPALDPEAGRELARLAQKVKRFHVVPLPRGAGELALKPADSLTIEDLRGVELDDDPPVLGKPSGPQDPNQTDGCAPGEAPYVAPGIRPFRLRRFTCEFNYGGWHNFGMIDYASAHGFQVLFPYVMRERGHFPKGTRWLQWGSFVDWHKFLQAHQIPPGRYDRLADLDVAKELLDSGTVWELKGPADDWVAMLDLEHGAPLSPDDLRKQEWFPRGHEAEQAAFERKYYHGYLLTYTAPIEALRQKGWKSVGVYPQPYGSGWYALLGLAGKGQPGIPDPAQHWPWQQYGKEMVAAQDVLYPDIYVYYWSAQNVAYTLARMDFDRALLASAGARKPLRPYFWPLLHGGDADYHWWNQQPLPTEDERALFAFPFFAGCDGVVLWNWSEFANHHVAPPLWTKAHSTAAGDVAVAGGTGTDVMVGREFALAPEGAPAGAAPTRIKRYDVLHILSLEGGTVRFRHIDTTKQKGGPAPGEGAPVYAMKQEELLRHLRPTSEPVAGAVEGLALVKPLEYLLRRGEVKVDVPALDQFAKTLPIVRRVKLGPLHVLATYDPRVVHEGRPAGEIVLRDFDGRPGLTLRLPADEQVRIYVLREP